MRPWNSRRDVPGTAIASWDVASATRPGLGRNARKRRNAPWTARSAESASTAPACALLALAARIAASSRRALLSVLTTVTATGAVSSASASAISGGKGTGARRHTHSRAPKIVSTKASATRTWGVASVTRASVETTAVQFSSVLRVAQSTECASTASASAHRDGQARTAAQPKV